MPVNRLPDPFEGRSGSGTPLAARTAWPANREGLAERLAAVLARTAPEVLAGDFLACDRLDLSESLGQVQVPVLLACGREDKMTPPTLTDGLKDAIPGASLAWIEGAGHIACWRRPGRSTRR